MKIMIMGQSGHGKDTVCEMLVRHGYAWASSSEFACDAKRSYIAKINNEANPWVGAPRL